jgi:hypothetical protein
LLQVEFDQRISNHSAFCTKYIHKNKPAQLQIAFGIAKLIRRQMIGFSKPGAWHPVPPAAVQATESDIAAGKNALVP